MSQLLNSQIWPLIKKKTQIKVTSQIAPLFRLITLPGSLWMTVGLLTATSDFLKSWADTHPLVTSQKQPHGPKQGTDPTEVAFPFNRQPSKDRQHLTPTCVNCQLPTTDSTAVGMPLLSHAFHRCDREKLLLWAEREGFQGFFRLWCQPFPTAWWTCAICGIAKCLTGEGDKPGTHTHLQVVVIGPT